MIFYKVASAEPVVKIVADTLLAHLSSGQSVLWLVSGGSAIPLQVKIAEILEKHSVSNLSVALMDERYGPVGHADSNWQQLLAAGFSLPGAELVPILKGKDRLESTREFNNFLKEKFKKVDYALGLFGIGSDGHTAGILPGSPHLDTLELALSYVDSEATSDYTEGVYRDKDRITITPACIAQLSEAVVCAFGPHKPQSLDRLEQDLPISEQPSQALKQVQKLSIYSDYKGVSV